MGLPVVWIVILGGIHPGWAAAAAGQGAPEEGEEARRPEAPPSERRFFDRPIDFWRTGGGRADAVAPKPVPAVSQRPAGTATPELLESIWAEPVRLPDGRFAIYLPPRAVLEFLDNPTEESLKGYLDWQRSRAEKMKKALELLEAHRARESEVRGTAPPVEPEVPAKAERPPDPKVKSPDPPRSPGGPTFEMIYFHRKGCPPCERQDGLLSGWLEAHPEGMLKVVEFGESPGLWQEHGVRGTPTLLLRDLRSGRFVLLEGFADARRLEEALRELRGARPQGVSPPVAPTPPEKSPKEAP